jgi:hypothetical protein
LNQPDGSGLRENFMKPAGLVIADKMTQRRLTQPVPDITELIRGNNGSPTGDRLFLSLMSKTIRGCNR